MQKMINICEDFGLEYDMMFNESKTVCIMFGQYYAKPTLYVKYQIKMDVSGETFRECLKFTA